MKHFWGKGVIGLIMLSAAHAAIPTITALHVFNGTDGDTPYAPLMQASDGNFYGTTVHGGDDGHGCTQGCDGTIFKITPQGQYTLLHTFVGGGTVPVYQNGRNPEGGLIEGPDGYLYGTTFDGGFVVSAAGGIVYKISKSGDFQKLHDFCGFVGCKEGTEPQGGLLLGSDGFFYGTTTSPPAFPQIFRMSSTGVYSTIEDLYSTGFGTPLNGLVHASDGDYYGVAIGGVFRVTPPLGFAPVYFFNSPSDGSGSSEVIQASDGNLYGATYPGPGNPGGVFRLTLTGTFQKILTFTGTGTGTSPNALLQASDGNLWGTTNISSGTGGGGTVYTLTIDGTFLQSVFLTAKTGIRPVAPLIQGIDGKLYGTATTLGTLPSGFAASGTIFVVDAGLAPKLTSIAITAANNSIARGTGEQFTATGTYGDNSTSNITTQVTWNSSNAAVATIGANTGLATAAATGSTIITASLAGVTSNMFMLTVTPATLTSISIAGPSSVIAGKTAQFAATGTYTDFSTANITSQVTWNSSSPGVATIGANTGLASGVAAGSTNITASLNGLTSNLLSLTVPTPPVVTAYKVLFGSQSYNLIGSTRKRLPWQVAGIQVVFSEPIASGAVSSLSGVTATGLSGLGTNTLTWTINPIPLGNFATALAGSGGAALLDAAGSSLGGGTGFTQNFKVLPGDFNDDGFVSSADMVGVNNATVAAYNVFADINGDGIVNITDVQIVRTKIGTSLP